MRSLNSLMSHDAWLPDALGAFAGIVAERDCDAKVADARAELAFELYGNALQLLHQQEIDEQANDASERHATA